MSGSAGQPSELRFVIFNQLHDLGLKGILCRVDRADGLRKRLLLELFLNCQAQLGELFDVAARMKLQLFELGKNRMRFLRLRRISGLRRLFSLLLWCGAFLSCRRFRLLNLRLPGWLGRTSLLSSLAFMLLLLSDFLSVCYVSWVSHHLIDGFQSLPGRVLRANSS